jgi:hypothetical protein
MVFSEVYTFLSQAKLIEFKSFIKIKFGNPQWHQKALKVDLGCLVVAKSYVHRVDCVSKISF